MPESVATPGTTRGGVGELVRSWQPEGDPWADVVIVHGLAEHSGRYERTGRLMSDAGLRVESFDLVGFGASGGPRGHVDSFTTYLDQVEDHLGNVRTTGRPTVLMGHSMGGLIALEYALAQRPAPELLILSAPALFGGEAWQRALAPVMARLAPKLTIPNSLKGEQLSRDEAVGEAYFSDPLVFTKSTAKLGNELFTAMSRAKANVARLAIPTLVIHGGADTIVPPSSSVPLGELPGVERKLYVTLRHETMNEPEGPQVVADIIGWLRAKTPALG